MEELEWKIQFCGFFVPMDLKIRTVFPHQESKRSAGVQKFVELFVVVDNTEVWKGHSRALLEELHSLTEADICAFPPV